MSIFEGLVFLLALATLPVLFEVSGWLAAAGTGGHRLGSRWPLSG